MVTKVNVVGLWVVFLISMLACNGDKLDAKQQAKLLAQGKEITSSTFKALSSTLQSAMAEGGIVNAVQYCNLEALPITDSLAAKYNVEIKRSTDRPRNPSNKASAEELKMINTYKGDLLASRALEPRIVSDKSGATFYAPILTQPMCLNCHGDKKNIAAYSNISTLYPDDMATAYQSGEVRGLWRVDFLEVE